MPPPAPGRSLQRDYGLGHVARRLGRPETERVCTTISYVRELIRTTGFPEPLGFRRWKGELVKGAAAVTAASRWPAAAVDTWFARWFPNHAAAEEAVEAEEWAAHLDAAAFHLDDAA